jgi:hypothetical protein
VASLQSVIDQGTNNYIAITYCWKVVLPSGFTWTLGSANPRTPDIVPKYWWTLEYTAFAHVTIGA